MKPKIALVILLIFAVLTGLLMFFVIKNDRQKSVNNYADQSKQEKEINQKTEEELLEEKRLEMLRILDQNKEADTMTPEEKEKKRLEMLEVLDQNKEAETMTPEEKEKKRLEMLEVLNQE